MTTKELDNLISFKMGLPSLYHIMLGMTIEETNEYDYGPYEMEKYTNAFHEEYNRDIFTPRALNNLVYIGYTDEGDYYIKNYNSQCNNNSCYSYN